MVLASFAFDFRREEYVRNANCFRRFQAEVVQRAGATGVHVLTNTGYYGSANDRYAPKHAYDESARQIAARWVKEALEGIDGTDIRPGFMKLGVDTGPLSEIDSQD